LLEFLNKNSGAFALIFSFFVAGATVMYAILTRKLVSETKKMREAQTEPKISVTIQPSDHWLMIINMVIQNIGLGPAYNISFKINPDFEFDKGEFLSELGFIKRGLNYLAPNQKLQFILTFLSDDFKEKINKVFEVTVCYRNRINKEYTDVYLLDFSQLIGLNASQPPLYRLAKNIETIQNDIHDLSTGYKRIKVIRYSQKDVDKENKLLEEQWKKRQNKSIIK